MNTATTYAGNLKGTAMFALNNWRHNAPLAERNRFESEKLLHAGRCQAYASILRQITGSTNSDDWQALIEAIR